MQTQKTKKVAHQRWEDEGGTPPPPPVTRPKQLTGKPSLPTGYVVQPIEQLPDMGSGFSYEFNHVYGPAHTDARGEIHKLQTGLCFWRVSTEIDGERERCWINYAQLSEIQPKMSFDDFGSLDEMKDILQGMFR